MPPEPLDQAAMQSSIVFWIRKNIIISFAGLCGCIIMHQTPVSGICALVTEKVFFHCVLSKLNCILVHDLDSVGSSAGNIIWISTIWYYKCTDSNSACLVCMN